MAAEKILLVDDEEDILEFLSYNLEKEGFQVFTASNGRQAVSLAKEILPDLVVLDVMMPDMDGVETCVELRNIPALKSVLIAFLTARSEDYSQIAALEAGADDYITKPIKPRLFVSKINSLLRRKNTGEEIPLENIEEGGIKIDMEKYLVTKDNKSFSMPKKEFDLLKLLMSKPGKVFQRNEILDKVWGGDVVVGDRTIDVHIRKLREKLGNNSIQTVKGVGYKFLE